MKKKYKLYSIINIISILAIITVFLIIFFSSDINVRKTLLKFIPLMFGIVFIINVISVFLFLRKAALPKDIELSEEEKIKEINSSYGVEQKELLASYQMNNAKNAWKASSKKERVGGCLFGLLLISIFFGAVICLFLREILAFLILFSCFFVIMISTLIIKKVRAHRYFTCKIDYSSPPISGTVLSCIIEHQSTIGSKHTNSTACIVSTIYKLKVDIFDDIVVTFSKSYIPEGSIVELYKVGKKYVLNNNTDDNI